MNIQRIAAFPKGLEGGNPAGVVLCELMPDAITMQSLAAEIGYSETVFAAPHDNGWRVRYFSPKVEVDFCGHATIALGATLAKHFGQGVFHLTLNHAQISVEGYCSDQNWGAAFVSPPTHSRPISTQLLTEALSLFGLTEADLDPRIPPAIAHAGGDHLILAVNDRRTLQAMQYHQENGHHLSVQESLVTFNLIYAEQAQIFYSRNPFPVGGVFEDPATGSAAAALAGYLRDINWPHSGSIVIYQGEDMGMPSCLTAEISPRLGAGIKVSGNVRPIV
ncbi:PhzF family phenazine biosynthesis protein [Psychrobacter piscatorii]|uniref:PhzF family phenazine biosynthesis protein n=1 Tax=Psychrobacter piscatorii TaxID=554343 RepID=A0A0T6DS07_9GAMM|nr:PhzF family phenazine biosynthesis protein [Psychrobacter piscatorii]KRU22703.1 PhzF family phenazine biosynthesis protein [Psychrobacter piscatorii]